MRAGSALVRPSGRVGFADAAVQSVVPSCSRQARRGNRQVPSHYFTALMVRVSVPDGTLTVTLSPFFRPTKALPTGDSTEIRPADGSLSTAPTRWNVSTSPSLSTTSMVEPGCAVLE